MANSIPTLNHGHAPRSRKRLFFRLAAILILVAPWFYIAPRVAKYFDHLMAVHRYMTAQAAECAYAPDPSVVCYTDDPSLANTLGGNANYARPVGYSGTGAGANQFMRTVSDPDDSNFSHFGYTAGYNRMSGMPKTPVFMHQRRSPAGHERLVSIGLLAWGPMGDNSINICLQTDVFTLAKSAAAATNVSSHLMALYRWNADHPMTVFAGQPDPADASHFTIPIDFRGERRVIDGYLRDDDTVLLDPHLGNVVSPTSGRGIDAEDFNMDSYALNTVAITTPAFKLMVPNPAPNVRPAMYSSCAFSPDGTLLAVAMSPPIKEGDNWYLGPARLRLLDAKTGKDVREFQTQPPMEQEAYAIAFSPDGALLATMDTPIHIWNVATGEQIGECAAGNVHDFSLMRFDADGKQLIATCKGIEYVFSLPDLKLQRTQPVPPLNVAGVIVQPQGVMPYDGKRLPTYRDDKTTPAPGQFHIAFGDTALQQQAAGAASGISPDGHWFAWPYGHEVSIVDLQKQAVCLQRMVWVTWSNQSGFISANFSPDGRLLASSFDLRGLSLWRMPDCDLLYDIQIQPAARVLFFTISPDDKHVATIDTSGNLNVWDLPAAPTTNP